MAELANTWPPWTCPLVLIPASNELMQRREDHLVQAKTLDPKSSTKVDSRHRQNQSMVPGSNSDHRSRVLVDILRSGDSNDNTPPPQPPPQNHLPFPSSLPLPPPPDLSAMLALLPEIPLRRANKLRRPTRMFSTPPVLAPLSFTEEPELDLDFEHISHDVQPHSPHPLHKPLTNEYLHSQDAPSPELCQDPKPQAASVARRLTKRRRPSLQPIPQEQVVSPSSGATAAATVTGNPAAPITAVSQISSHSNPHRARSETGHGIRHSVSIKRQSIIRKFSMRTPKLSLESQATSSGPSSAGPTTPLSTSFGIWSRRRATVSEAGHDSTNEDLPISLPLVRVTSPFSVNIPFKPDADDLVPTPPGRTDLSNSRSCSPTNGDPVDSSNLISDSTFIRPRAKFTLEGTESEAEMSNPPSPSLRARTVGYFTPDSPNVSLSRTHSPSNPLSKPEPIVKLPRRRWTFAMAMTDEDITDEILVEELERMRLRKNWSGSVDEMGDIWDPDYVLFGTFETQELKDTLQETQNHVPDHSDHNLRHSANLSYTPSLPSFPHQHRVNSASLPGSGSTQQWQIARRVLLACRELVRTERHYLASLQALSSSETESAPPPLMLRYVDELIKVSQSYLAQMEGNPSSWGVAASFLGAEEAIDRAFVGWCGVVGMWFDDTRDESYKIESKPPSSYPKKLNKSSNQKLSDEEVSEKPEDVSTGLKKIVSWRRSLTSIADLATNAPSSKKKEKGSMPPPSFSLYGLQHRRNTKPKKLPIRDLAILPTQRIMRYVLLYRDLLTHTPSTSPSCSLIKRAADAALRIAQKCDRAQTNSAFIVDNNSRETAKPSAVTTSTATDYEGDNDLSASTSVSHPDSSPIGTS